MIRVHIIHCDQVTDSVQSREDRQELSIDAPHVALILVKKCKQSCFYYFSFVCTMSRAVLANILVWPFHASWLYENVLPNYCKNMLGFCAKRLDFGPESQSIKPIRHRWWSDLQIISCKLFFHFLENSWIHFCSNSSIKFSLKLIAPIKDIE